MKRIISMSILFCLSIGLNAQESTQNKTAIASTLIGEWIIDLRPTPDAEAYLKSFVIDSLVGKSFSGTFYGSPIENGLLNSDWESIFFAFTTQDNTYPYYHSGYVKDGRIYGISYCPGRGFTIPWNGDKNDNTKEP
ncbi:hypothetical protein [Gaetbulibacter aestuarii]|uniref:Uncharacterized protein n=1 Tax=Gaetbulibacter aestuarii TaxID=1502358 RepID=A0ABW7N1U1_9FLAO